jgi:hypothetical protein
MKNQRWYYSGYKKQHGMNWQVIVMPDGIMNSVMGPWEGKANDWGIFTSTRVARHVERMMRQLQRQMLYLYGDSAYHLTTGIMQPFTGVMNRHERKFNAELAGFRISIKHAFGEIFNQFKATAFAKGMKVGKQAVAAFFLTWVLLCNCLTILNGGNKTSKKYGLSTPTLEEYLGLGVNDLAGIT